MNNKQVLELFSDAEINARRLQELSNLLGRLKKIKVEPLLVKGAGLIKTIYPHPALRPMDDIDLLVKPDDFNSARRLLINDNYQPISKALGHFFKNTSFNPPAPSRTDGIPFGKRPSRAGMHIDLHWDIWYLRKEEFENLWKEGLSFGLNDTSAKTLAPEEHFIYIAVHSILQHGILDAVRLQDLTMLINNTANFNWSLLVKKTRQYQLETLLSIVLERLQEIQSRQSLSGSRCSPLDSPSGPAMIPLWVLKQLQYRGLFNRLCVRLIKSIIKQPAIPHIGNLLKIQAVRGFRGKIRYFFSYIFPSELFMKEKYPLISKHPLLLYCYYLHRPIYLTCQGIRLLVHQLRG